MKPSILIYRILHGLVAVFFISCIGILYYCVLAGQYPPLLWVAIGALALEGLAVFLNKGDCPLAFLNDRLGDPKPFFNLFLPAKVAKAAFPFFTILIFLGLVLLGLRAIFSPG